MRKIGIVASGSSETRARVVLNEGEEMAVRVEDLVLIKNRNGNDIFAVCRGGLGSNDNLKTGAYSPGVAYARRGRKPSSAKEFYEFKLSVIGDVTTQLAQNKRIIAPCSDVYVFEERDNPMAHLGPDGITVGYYKEHPSWKVPVNPKFIPYHIGVFSVSIDHNDPLIYEEDGHVRVEKIGNFVDRFYEEGEEGHPVFVEGIKVPSFSSRNLKVAWRPLRYVLRHKYQGPMYRLTLQGGKAVTVTPAHSVFAVGNGRVREEKVENLAVGDFILAPSTIPSTGKHLEEIDIVECMLKIDPEERSSLYLHDVPLSVYLRLKNTDTWKREKLWNKVHWKKKRILPLRYVNFVTKEEKRGCKIVARRGAAVPAILKVDERLGRLLGYYIAEGYLTINRKFRYRVCFDLNKGDTKIIQNLKDIFEDTFSTHVRIRKRGQRGIRISVYGKPLCLFLDRIATRGAKSKRVPDLIINARPEVRRAFLEAWVQGDYGVTASEELASDMGYLLLFDGIVTTFTQREIANVVMPSGSLVNKAQSFELLFPSPKEMLRGKLRKIRKHDEPKLLPTKCLPNPLREISYTKKTARVTPKVWEKIARRAKLIKAYAGTRGKNSHESALDGYYRLLIGRKYLHRDKATLKLDRKGASFLAETRKIERLANAGFAFLRIKGIEKVEPNGEYVYDVSVPECENFVGGMGGVFCHNTGGGKSFLARYELIPLLRRAGYDVLIFDWKGSDYVPYFDKVIRFSNIALDDDVVVSYLSSKMDYFGYSGEYKRRNAVRDALEDVIYETKWRGMLAEEFRGFLQKNVLGILRSEHMDRQGRVDSYGRRYIRKFRKAVRRLEERDFENILGRLTPEDILNIAREDHVVVIDVSQTGKEEKLSIFLAIAKHLRELMEGKMRLNLALLIDEGPQYCVAGDTLVQLGDGRLEKIEDVVESGYVGDVASVDRSLKIGHGRVVKHFRVVDRRLKIVTAKGKNSIVVSPDTRLLWMNHEGEPEWVEGSKLRRGDYVAYARRMPNPNREGGQLPPKSLVYLAGLIASDGCLSLSKYRRGDHYNHGYYISLINKNRRLHEKFCDIVKKLTGKTPHTRLRDTWSYESRLGNKWLFKKLHELGIPIGKKHRLDVPAKVATLPNHLLKEYLMGLFDGDGSIGATKCRVLFSTGNREYADKIKHLLLRFGISSSMSTGKAYSHSRRAKTDTEIFNVVMWGADARKFVKEIGFSHPKKACRADNILRRSWSKYNHSHSDTIPYQGHKVKKLRLKAGIARIPFGIENTREQNKCSLGRLTLTDKIKKLMEAGLSEDDVESLNRLVASDLKWLMVSEVEQLPEGSLYDLTINGSSNFVANGFVVHNCPFMPRGLEYDTTEMISQLCALGRSYNLSVVLLSQGIAGEIGINASIRRNLNTQLIGKIHPLDLYEASQLLSALDLDPNFLVSLPEGHFYFLGNMNPSPVPLLITFSIEEDA